MRFILVAHLFYQAFASSEDACADENTLLQRQVLRKRRTQVSVLEGSAPCAWIQPHEMGTRCTEEGWDAAVSVADQNECEQLATGAGHVFYSYRITDGHYSTPQCYSSAACTPYSTSTNTWSVYQESSSWIQSGEDGTRCTEEGWDAAVSVADQNECRQLATGAGHAFYSYRITDRHRSTPQCYSSAACTPRSTSTNTWSVFEKACMCSGWTQSGEDGTRCTEEGWDAAVGVADQSECEQLATGAGHAFYSYRITDGHYSTPQCYSSAACTPYSTSTNTWSVFGRTC